MKRPAARASGLIASLLVAIGALALSSSASASTAQVTFFDAPRELSGELGTAERAAALDDLDALGVDVVRLVVYWRQIAPSRDSAVPPSGFDPRNPNTYGPQGANWAQVDAVVQGAAARGMDVALVPSGEPPTGRVPRWASRDPSSSQSDPDPTKFDDFMYALGLRYAGGRGSAGYARYISAWNEPNLALFLQVRTGKAASKIPILYRRLIASAQAGLFSAGWSGKFLIGETGPTSRNNVLDPIPFMRRTLCLNNRYRLVPGCTRPDAAGWAHHPYSFVAKPFKRPVDNGQITFANLNDLGKAINRARAAGALPVATRLFVTEAGYPSLPDTTIGVPRSQQAQFNAITEFMAYNSRGISSFAQYLLRDQAPAGSLELGFASGLCPSNLPTTVHSPGTGVGCKPAYEAFRTPLVARAKRRSKGGAARVRIWGHVRPARSPTVVQIRYRDPGGGPVPLRTVTTDANGYFTFPARNRPGRRWGVTWNGAPGPLVRAYTF